jgi:hypothetical protein
MPAREYVNAYLDLLCRVRERRIPVAVRMYLQDNPGHRSRQAQQARQAHSALTSRIPSLPGYVASTPTPGGFQVQGKQYLSHSISRVFIGKGAPNEIQDTIYLASLCNLVDVGTLAAYANLNLGMDCGGFVANYWGIGRPTLTHHNPTGSDGFKPRWIWDAYRACRRTTLDEIQPDDAAVFFDHVYNENPSIPAPLVNGVYDTTRGSKAFHIGVVAAKTAVAGSNRVTLEIAESSGGPARGGGDGVNVRSLGQVTATVSHGLVYCPEGNNRIYFVGRPNANPPYLPYPPDHLST